MKYCSPRCAQIASRVLDGVELDGIRFTPDAHGYYVSSDGRGIKLHRYVWEKVHGAIPEGHVVHHKNENKADNRLQNLELYEWGKHTAEHSRERWASGRRMGKNKKHFVCDWHGCDRPSKARGLCTKHYQRHMAKERGKWL